MHYNAYRSTLYIALNFLICFAFLSSETQEVKGFVLDSPEFHFNNANRGLGFYYIKHFCNSHKCV